VFGVGCSKPLRTAN